VAENNAVNHAVCEALSNGARSDAISLLRRYPFDPKQTTVRKYGKDVLARVFVRDGFLDRYSGERLIFPPVLRLLSLILPAEFPYHPNWKTTVKHPAFWELGATIDHVIPVTRGGKNDESNLVTTSMVRNSAKLSYTIEELGWTLHKPGIFDEWDGLLRWFLQYPAINPGLLENELMRRWHRAATLAISASKGSSTDASPGTLETLP
jgi:hypothetical protein